jgi:hypothetical protein
MDGLRIHLDRALDGEPPPAAPQELARAAMAGGTRLRRRRQLTLGGAALAVTVLATVAAGLAIPMRDAPTPVPAQVALPSATPALCAGVSAEDDATEASVYLAEQVTDVQRDAIDTTLRADPRLSTVHYDSRQQAYERFRQMYRDGPPEVFSLYTPEEIAQVTADQFPESFRLTLTDPAAYPQLEPDLRALPGVDEVVGRFCPHGTQREGE